MKNIHYYIYMVLVAVLMAACSNDDLTSMTTSSDEVNGPISFSASAQEPQTRARDYRPWGTGDPTTMGVFGFYNLNAANFTVQNGDDASKTMFKNTQVTYDADAVDAAPWKAATKWRYTTPKYWADYAWCTSTDFFAYMPYKAQAGISNPAANQYTVTIPGVDMGEDGFWSGNDTVLICHEPIHKDYVGDVIEYRMDHVLTAFQIKFKLGAKMDDVRDFVVKQVKLKGATAKSGNVSRTYTWDGSKWTAGDVTWSVTASTAGNAEKTILNNYADVDAYNEAKGTSLDADGFAALTDAEKTKYVTVTSAEAESWGDFFYVIPNDFHPTIEVTYNVTLNGQDGEITRKGVVSEIVFSGTAPNNTFSGYTAGKTGYKNTILINIVPDYLYVLADKDQVNGYLVIQE